MALGNPKGERNFDLDISGEKVEQSQSIKTLGVNLDENLNFRDHIRCSCKKVGGMIGILRRLKKSYPSQCQVPFVQISYHATPYLLPRSVAFLHRI